MATGDITNLVVNADGTSGSFRVADLVAGIPTAFEAGKSAVLNVQSDGYTGTTLTSSTGWDGDLKIEHKESSFVSTGTTYASDTFTEASGTPAMSAHVPEIDLGGGGWTGSLGTYVVDSSSGAAKNTVTAGTTWTYRVIECAADGRLVVPMQGATNGRTGLCVRYVDDNNLIRFQTRIADTATGAQLVKRVAGVETTIATITGIGSVPSSGAVFVTEIVLDGDDIKVYIDGVLILSATESAFNSNTKAGISSRSTSNFWYEFSFKQNAGYVLVNWYTEHYIAVGDTVAITSDAGLISDGTDSSNAAIAVSGTNSSTLAQQPPKARHAFPVDSTNELLSLYQATSGSIYVDVLAGHANGIAAVKVSITDGSSTLTDTQTALSLSEFADNLYADELTFQGYTYVGSGVYKCGPFDLSSLADGKITLTMTAYPLRGGSGTLITDVIKIVNNDGGTYISTDKFVDFNGTLTLSSGLTADVLDNQLITGNTSGAIAVTNGSHSSGATSIAAHYMTGTFSTAETVTITNHQQAGVATGVFSSSSWVGSDSAAGTEVAPFRSELKAIQSILEDGDYGNVYIKGRGATAASTTEIQNVAAISIRTWPGYSGNMVINGSTAASKIRHLHYYCDLNCATQWGTGQDSGTLFSGSGLTSEGHISLRGTLTHARGRDGSRHIFAKPVNGSGFPDGVCQVGQYVTEIGTDVVAAQGAQPRARNVMGYKVANNAIYDPIVAFCIAIRDCKVAPNKIYYDTGTLVGVPAIGDIIYQAATGYWVVITDYYDPGKLFIFDPSAGGSNNQATTNRQFSDDYDAAFYDPANFNQSTGLPTGSSDGTMGIGIVHPDGVQNVGSGTTPHNSVIVNDFVADTDGQLYFNNDIINTMLVNFLGIRTQANQQLSQFGASSSTGYATARNCLIWNSTFANQELTCRTDSLTDRVGFQVRNVVAAKFTGDYQRHGIYDSNNVARITGSVAGMDVTLVADPFEDGVAGNADYNGSTNDYRPTTSMPTTTDVPWAFDMLGNALAGDGSDYVGAIQEVVGSVTTPTVTTGSITAITATTATAAGNATADGGAPITAKGICYKTSSGPTTSDTVVSGGTGTGAFTASLIGLASNTVYYVKAYATNSQGTVYGSEVSFQTAPVVSSATIGTSGTTLTIAANAAIAGHVGLSLTDISPPVSLTYSSGDPGTSQVYDLSRVVLTGEAPTLAYTAGDIVSVSGSVPLATITGGTVTNNSTQVPATSTIVQVEHPPRDIRVGNQCVLHMITKDASKVGVWPDADPSPADVRIYRNGSTSNAGSVTVERLSDVTGGFEIVYTRTAEAGGDVIRIMVPYAVSSQAFEELYLVQIVQDDPFTLDSSGTYGPSSWAAYFREHSDSTSQNNLLIGALSDDLAYNTDVCELTKELAQDTTEQIAIEGLNTTPAAQQANVVAALATYDAPTKTEMDAALSVVQSAIIDSAALDYASLTTMLDTITAIAATAATKSTEAALDASKTPRKSTAIAAGAAVTETWTVVTDTTGTLVITRVVS
jgi:hypothetical protein